MPYEVRYEWDVESVTQLGNERDDENDDIFEHYFSDKLNELPDYARDPWPGADYTRLVLVCEEFGAGVHRKSWAYVKPDGTLPGWFLDSYNCEMRKVPQRFHNELERFLRKNPNWKGN